MPSLSVKWTYDTGPQAKRYNGEIHSAREGPVQWSSMDDDTLLPVSSDVAWENDGRPDVPRSSELDSR